MRTPRKGSAVRYNTILDDKARVELDPYIKQLWGMAPEMMKRKPERANVQQAWMLAAIRSFFPDAWNSTPPTKFLCAGSFEDTAQESLVKFGYDSLGIDPVQNFTLHDYLTFAPNERYDVAFATSVIEHVQDHHGFIRELASVVKPGGFLFLTCDFKRGYTPGQPTPTTSLRFYDDDDLEDIYEEVLGPAGFRALDQPLWSQVHGHQEDFTWEGYWYAFATLGARKAT